MRVENFSHEVSVMRFLSELRSMAMAVAVAGLFAASGAEAQDLDEPFFGGAYAPGPNYAYSSGDVTTTGVGVEVGPIGIGAGVRTVGYNEGYYYGGYQYPAGGYGGGPYRRAAYSAADVYVTNNDCCACPPCATAYRPIVRAHYVPAPAYRVHRVVRYRPSPHRHVVARRICNCGNDGLY
jgi:hypothetical protein